MSKHKDRNLVFFTHQVDWFSRIDDRKAPNVKQYLRGLRKYNLAKSKAVKPYNHYTFYLGLASIYFGVKWLKHNLQTEFDRRE